mmetsp:Transcript_1036/g.1333  ORF Transcript_1036/g.1333 Transcript_1036/m.1333 type:complete len:82 (+) Transcript_1036:320-565(+)
MDPVDEVKFSMEYIIDAYSKSQNNDGSSDLQDFAFPALESLTSHLSRKKMQNFNPFPRISERSRWLEGRANPCIYKGFAGA